MTNLSPIFMSGYVLVSFSTNFTQALIYESGIAQRTYYQINIEQDELSIQ